MRIGQGLELMLFVLDRLVVAGLADLDRHEVVGDVALMHDDVRIDRFAEMIVGRDDGSVRQPHRALTQPVVVAIDLPAGKLLFDVHRKPVRQRALAEVPLQEKGFACIKLAERGDQLVQFVLHAAVSVPNIAKSRRSIQLQVTQNFFKSALRSAAGPGGDRFRQRLVEVLGGRDRAPGDAHALRERDQVDRRAVEIEHVHAPLAGLAGADAVELAAQDLVDAVGEDRW